MAAQPDNTSTVAQPGSVSNGSDHQAPAEPSHLTGDRVAVYTPDNVVARASSGTTNVALSIEQHRARVKHVLERLKPVLPTQGGNGDNAYHVDNVEYPDTVGHPNNLDTSTT